MRSHEHYEMASMTQRSNSGSGLHSPRLLRPFQLASFFALLLLGCIGLKPLAFAAQPDPIVSIQASGQGRQILAEHCFDCHGEKKQEAGLRLDYRADALTGGDHGPAIRPGSAKESLLMTLVRGEHPDIRRMPGRGEPLADGLIQALAEWIDTGANYPEGRLTREERKAKDHWAFQAIEAPPLPRLKESGRVANPVDLFVLAKLEEKGGKASAPADRVTLARRLALDLTGLPPTPESVDAFVADKAEDAYGKYVRTLLDSPHFGERWARWWLDAARYADSNGFEKDRTRSIWPWRDWVIEAFNNDMPFDRFTIEQLAGDLLTEGGLKESVATGFLRNSMINMEGGIEPEKFRVEAIIDRVDAVSRTWLGLTLACAQCHDHKYDPVSQRDYFRFYALLNQDDEPLIDVPTSGQQDERERIRQRAQALEEQVLPIGGETLKRLERWEETIAGRQGQWEVLNPDEWHSQPMKFEKQEDLSLLGGGDVWNNSVVRVWVDVPDTGITGIRLEALNDGNLPFGGPGLQGLGEFNLCEMTVDATPLRELKDPKAGSTDYRGTTNRIAFSRAMADAWSEGGNPEKAIDGVLDQDGWKVDFTKGRRNQERRIVFEAAEPFGFKGGTRLLITLWQRPKESKLSNHLIGRFRLSMTTEPGPLVVDPLSENQRRIASKPVESRAVDEQKELLRVLLFQDESLAEKGKEWDALWAGWPRAGVTTLAMQKRPVSRETREFRRGDWTRPGDPVNGGTPSVLPTLEEGMEENRLGLARWLVDPANPLTSRVIVNRVWQSLFGRGMVATPEDFGTRADLPTHPELLDWLALEFRDGGWSMKELLRLIVTSATYQQVSSMTAAQHEWDPDNRWLGRGPRVRIEAEMIQDIALAVSGLLSPKIGGPSVFPPLPDGVMQLSYGPIGWNVSAGDDRYRRALYTFWKRSAPHPMLLTFDAPSAEQSCVRRPLSNTPLQALVTLNEPTLHDAARWLGWNAAAASDGEPSKGLIHLYRQVLSRGPEEAELKVLERLYNSALKEYESRPSDAATFAFADPKSPPPRFPGVSTPQIAAFAAVSRAILNLDEALTKE